jgi:hypothetical protein
MYDDAKLASQICWAPAGKSWAHQSRAWERCSPNSWSIQKPQIQTILREMLLELYVDLKHLNYVRLFHDVCVVHVSNPTISHPSPGCSPGCSLSTGPGFVPSKIYVSPSPRSSASFGLVGDTSSPRLGAWGRAAGDGRGTWRWDVAVDDTDLKDSWNGDTPNHPRLNHD